MRIRNNLLILALLLLPSFCYAGEVYIDGMTNDGHFVRVNGTLMTQNLYINFTGAGVSGTNGTDETAIAISGGSVNDTAYGTGWDGDNTTSASRNALYDKIETLGGGHDSVTLQDAADKFLSLSTQMIGLDSQAANSFFAGPLSGSSTVPSFRAMGSADIANCDIEWAKVKNFTTDLSGNTTDDLTEGSSNKYFPGNESIAPEWNNVQNKSITVEISDINATGSPGEGNFLRGDGSWQAVAGSGNVTNNGTASENNVTIFGASETEIKDSGRALSTFGYGNGTSNFTSDQATNTTSDVTFNNATATGGFFGDLTGDVTGNADTATNAANDDLSDNTTTDLAEGTNKYYTDEKVDDRVAAATENTTEIVRNYDDAANKQNYTLVDYSIAGKRIVNLTINDTLINNMTWTKLLSVPANTTSEQATNTSSSVVFANVNATGNFSGGGKGLYLKDKHIKFKILDLNNTFNQSLEEWSSYNLTFTKMSALVDTGTNITFMFYLCNATGTGGCIPMNASAWLATNGTELEVAAFENTTLGANNHTRFVVSAINGPVNASFLLIGDDMP